ncbi:MAG: hypothetical protein NZM04_07995 [Methylacidiphilales bacterium]|nr:hypothetical protein [Candidatus Methylacidiphilales bacterium]
MSFIHGRFLHPDLIGFEAGDVNWYRYVVNGVINATDPHGLWRHHGNWGGPGWVNGNTGNECKDFPREGEPGFVPPIDNRDRCYYEHDVCLNDCSRIKCEDERKECRVKCDNELSICLRNLPENEKTLGTKFEEWIFGGDGWNNNPGEYNHNPHNPNMNPQLESRHGAYPG